MSLWRKLGREAAGVVRSVCYDLGLLRPRQGRRTRRLMLTTGILATLAMAGLGWLGAVIVTQHGLGDLKDRPATADGPDLQVPDTSDGTVLSQIERATSPSDVPSSASARPTRKHEAPRTRSPSPTPTRSKPAADRSSPPPSTSPSTAPTSDEPEPPPESASPSYRRK